MAKSRRMEEQSRLVCEKVLNESWSKVERYTDEIILALGKKELGEKDLLLIKIAARAFVQKVLVERADTVALFGVDLHSKSPCGMNSKADCPCDKEFCIYME